MSAFQGVQLAANLGQQNFNQQLALDKRLDSRSDEMWDRYAFEKQLVAKQAEQLFYPTIEKMFSQSMEASPAGEFLSTISGESKVRVAEAVKNAEMDAQKRIQQRMIDEAIKSGPMMSIGGTTDPNQQAGDTPPPKTGEQGSPYAGPPEPSEGSPPPTAPRASDVKIPQGATPQQAQAIRNVANRGANAPASQRFGYNIPGVDLYPNPMGDGMIARFAKTGKTTIYSSEDLKAIQNAIKAENAALIADGFSSASKSASKQLASDMIVGENLNSIMGATARKKALEAGVIDQRTAEFMEQYGILPTEDEWQDLIKNHITLDGLVDKVRDRNREERTSAINSQIKANGVEIKALQELLKPGSGSGGAGGAYDMGGEGGVIVDGPEQQGRRNLQQDELDFLKKRQNKLHTQSRSLYNHNIHGADPSLGRYATGNNKQIDMQAMNDLMALTASRITGSTNPEDAMRLLPLQITDSEQFVNEFMPALTIEAKAAGWYVDNQNPLDMAWWGKNYITHVDESVRIESVRKKIAEQDAKALEGMAVERDLTAADSDYVSSFRESMGGKPEVTQEQKQDQSSYLAKVVAEQGIPELDESTSMTQGQITDFAKMMGTSDQYAKEYLRRYKEQYGLDTAAMQKYHANLTSGIEQPSDYEGEPTQQSGEISAPVPTTEVSETDRSPLAMDAMEGSPKDSEWASNLVREVNESWAPGVEKRFEEYMAGLPGLKEADVRNLIEPTMSKLESWVNDFVSKTRNPELELKPQKAKDYDTMMGVIDSVVDLLPLSEEERFNKLVDVISDRKTQEALDSRMEEAAKLEELLRFMSDYEQHNDKWERLKNLSEGQFGRGGVSGDSELGQKILDKQKMALQWLETGQNPYKNK